jgi:hypothetical protein
MITLRCVCASSKRDRERENTLSFFPRKERFTRLPTRERAKKRKENNYAALTNVQSRSKRENKSSPSCSSLTTFEFNAIDDCEHCTSTPWTTLRREELTESCENSIQGRGWVKHASVSSLALHSDAHTYILTDIQCDQVTRKDVMPFF